MKRVQVEWIDSITDGGWIDRNDATRRAAEPTVMDCISVGFLVADEEAYLLLATSQMGAELLQGTLQIPRVAITSVKELRR